MPLPSSDNYFERQEPDFEPENGRGVYQDQLRVLVAERIETLHIPAEVADPTLSVIGRLKKVDEAYGLGLAQEAQEVLLVALELGGAADRAMGVRTNEAAIFAAAATHDGGKATIAEIDPGILIRSQNGGFTRQDYEDNKQHVFYSAAMVREENMPLIPVELFPGGVVELVDIAKVDQASHDKQLKGSYLFGPELNWAERRVRDYATIADQALAMLFRDNDYNEFLGPEARWDWVEDAIAYVLNDYWYPPNVISAVVSCLKNNELIQSKLKRKYDTPARAGSLAVASAA